VAVEDLNQPVAVVLDFVKLTLALWRPSRRESTGRWMRAGSAE
jgi:hypothetical protein